MTLNSRNLHNGSNIGATVLAFLPSHAAVHAGLWLGKGDDAAGEDASISKASESHLTARRTIIVEDELFVALHLETILQDLRFEVCDIVATGAQAVRAVAEHQPELIFMDINLRGEIDGIDAARLIRLKLNIPIIFVTAYGDEATLTQIDRMVPGAIVLQKPPMIAPLASAINKLMGPIC